MNPAIAAYQEKFPNVQVNVENHDESQWGSDIESVQTALMAGKGPDLIYRPEYFFSDIQKTMSTGVFADLNPYFDLDPEISLEELETTVLTAGQQKGRQYVIPLTYNIPMLLTSKEALAEFGMDEAELRKGYLETSRQIASYLERRQDPPVYDRLFAGMYYPDYLGLSFLDYDKRTVDFSFPEFREAAELYKPFYKMDSPMVEGITTTNFDGCQDVLGRKTVLAPYSDSSGLEPLENARVIASEETPVLIPVLGTDGKSSGLIYNAAAVRSSGNQRNAWEFMKILLSEQIQNERINLLSFPIRKSCVSARLEEAMETPEGYQLDLGGKMLTMAALPEDVQKDYEAAYANLGHASFNFGYLSGQVASYLAPYYEDEKSLDACIEELTNAMEIYISE